MSTPLVGIALAAYKPNISYFEAQLASLIAQDYKNWVCCITFDSDLSAIQKEPRLQIFFEEARFVWQQNPDQLGSTKNFEVAIRLCAASAAKYICCSDQDDIWYPNKISKMVAAIELAPAMSVVHCDMHILKGSAESFERIKGTAWSLERRGINNVKPTDLLIRSVISGAGMIMDANLAREFPVIPYPAFEHDHWYPFVASTKGGVHPLPEPLYDYRIHGSNVSGLSEYRGFFHRTHRLPDMTVVQKCMVAYNGTAARCRVATDHLLPVPRIDEFMIRSFADLGLLYLLKAVQNFWCDRPIARACVSRAGGKIFRLIYRGFGEHRYR